jgi:hypothetical protein
VDWTLKPLLAYGRQADPQVPVGCRRQIAGITGNNAREDKLHGPDRDQRHRHYNNNYNNNYNNIITTTSSTTTTTTTRTTASTTRYDDTRHHRASELELEKSRLRSRSARRVADEQLP